MPKKSAPAWRYVGDPALVGGCMYRGAPNPISPECSDGSCPGLVCSQCPFTHGDVMPRFKSLFERGGV